MNKEAIKHIQDTANIPAMIEQVEQSFVPLAVLPSEYNVKDLEKYQENRSRFRGSFETRSIPDFIDYIKEHDKDGVRCFVNQEAMSAKTIFDLGTVEKPLHMEHTGNLSLKRTAAFTDLLHHEGNLLSQKELVAFIEDWHSVITPVSTDNEEIAIKRAIDSIRSITVESRSSMESVQEEFSSNMSAAEKIEMKNRDIQINVLRFKCQPYEGLKVRELELRLSISTDRGIGMKFRIVGKEAVEEEIATEFKDLIKSELQETKVQTFIGNFS